MKPSVVREAHHKAVESGERAQRPKVLVFLSPSAF